MLATAGTALLATILWLLAPPMGVDLAAQVARADFWARHGPAVLDLGWYGGGSPYQYSLVTPPLMAWLGGGISGARWLGAIAAVVAAVLLAALLVRTGARRPVLGGVVGVVGIVGNLVSGRITFTAGLAVGLATLLVMTARHTGVRRAGAVVGGVLTAATSPVAGLFCGLAGAALLLASRRRRPEGFLLAAGAGLAIGAVSALFGSAGPMNHIPSDTLRSATVSLLVAVLVAQPVIRVGALLSAAGVVAAAVLQTPVGLNAGRLSATFALAVLAAHVIPPRWARPRWVRPRLRRPALGLTAMLVAVAAWQHPVALREFSHAGDPMASPGRYESLIAQVRRFAPVGRIEVVPTRAYWESARLAGEVPLARGWLRQADIARNGLFFEPRLTSEGYRRWLQGKGVSLVAISEGPHGSFGMQEARLVRQRPPYLRQVWHGDGWTLFRVDGPPAVVEGATLLSSTDAELAVFAPTRGDVLVRIAWSRWLSVRGPSACLTPGADGWSTLRVREPGTYALTGSFSPGPRCAAAQGTGSAAARP
ncbi:hypothetical protein EV385_0166 [Krasilnikovia cinnamomea]|uniref:4-amino-4-deoxy-L-arabinose transferase-like glycosyltransferase n=1 Tax=Krasilnikovia cinnamomea TaxID=349313 RepID=A0A4Q7ZE01_9ACTN|nr:hypothetical protein [Krasilnikovia cinnamomea]RZU48451.1 hypothetical protein EV385_0166 [Krasilnikovia cinnamomea]